MAYPSASFEEQMRAIELELLRLQIRDLNTDIQLERIEKEATTAKLNAEIAARDNAILIIEDALKRKQAELKATTVALEEKNATLMETNKLFCRVTELLSMQKQVSSHIMKVLMSQHLLSHTEHDPVFLSLEILFQCKTSVFE